MDINANKTQAQKYMYIYPKKSQQKIIAILISNNISNLKNVEEKNLVKLFT